MATDIAGALAVVEAFNEGRISRTQADSLLQVVDGFGPRRVAVTLESGPPQRDRDSIVCSDKVKLAMTEDWDNVRLLTAVYDDGEVGMVMRIDSNNKVEFEWPNGVGDGATVVYFWPPQFEAVSELVDVARQYMDGKS